MRIKAVVAADYEDLGLIGVGGMGEVRRVRDRRLNRVMAMKVLRPEWAGTTSAIARFVEEAQATAQLQHPGIVPVHEIGTLADGRVYFTMKEVQGRTLGDVIRDVHDLGPRDALAPPWSFRRLIDAYRAVCDAVAYAHARGVVHRDLKPENVMVGDFGEVLVLDWGLAMVGGRSAGVDAVYTDRSADDALSTRAGAISGTPAYMAPEQARGETARIGPATDIYALGAILYEILSGVPPYRTGDAKAVVRQVIHGPPTPLASVRGIDAVQGGLAPTLLLDDLGDAEAVVGAKGTSDEPATARLVPLPDELVEACEWAMARDPDHRFASVAALSAEIAAWTDGARRREQALARVAEAEGHFPALEIQRAHASQLAIDARSQLAGLKPWEPAEKKQPAWDLEDEARRMSERYEAEEGRVVRLLHSALSDAPDLPDAHRALAAHFRRRHEQAEQDHDPQAPRYEALLRGHDRGEHAQWLAGTGTVTLHTESEGAEVELFRYVERGRRQVAEPAGTLGRTPLRAVPLPMGDWLLVLRAQGRPPARYPVRIARSGHWVDRAPGEVEPRTVRIPASLGDGEIWVPAGWYWRGGDPAASGSAPAERVWVESFVVQRFAVTNRQYQHFLDAMVAQGRLEEADRFAPRAQNDARFPGRRDGARFVLPETWLADAPIVHLDWASASACAQWLGGRLLTDDEWEKAARGVDQRVYPWGNGFDATFSRGRDSVEGTPSSTTVDSYPVDESPYGVRGLAGNACTWCQRGSGLRYPYRGGAWAFHASSLRSACRYTADPTYRYFGLGVRVARDP